MKAREWLKRGTDAGDPFDALSNYWRGFNNLYAGLKGQERDKIAKLLRARVNEEFAQRLLSTHAKDVEYLLSEPVIDMRENDKDTSPHIEAFREASTTLEKLVALFMVIYQVRCNFEHGQKSPSSERDRQLCQAAGPLVAAVVDHAA